jgi:hypothetical protein
MFAFWALVLIGFGFAMSALITMKQAGQFDPIGFFMMVGCPIIFGILSQQVLPKRVLCRGELLEWNYYPLEKYYSAKGKDNFYYWQSKTEMLKQCQIIDE